jgi:cell division septation protein DedD
MDQALKQRLVGATVLIILAVIILPMLLSGQPDLQNESRRIELPDKPPELSMDKRRFPIGQDSPERPSVVPEPVANEAAATPAEEPGGAVINAIPERGSRASSEVTDAVETGNVPESGENTSSEAQAETPRPAERASSPVTPEPEPLPSGPQGRYLVQVASFSNPASVNKVSEELNRLRLPVLMDNVTTEAGRLHRVRVGPFDSTAQAEAAIERIHGLNLDLQPRLLDLRPDENAPVTDPADPLVRWVIQAGVFTASENSDQLVEALRSNGFSAYSERVDSNGKTVFKVRIGPVPERRRAEELDAELERKMGIDGLVMSVD